MAPRPLALLPVLAAAVWLAGCAVPGPPPAPPAPTPPAPPSALPTPSPPCDRILWIEIHKSARRLDAACLGGGRASWTVALGRQPSGAKRSAGDHRTPEGSYHLVGRPRSSRFHRFLAIDYPSLEDAERARAEGRISPHDLARVAAAHHSGALPPADTALGGSLGLHGEGERWRGDSADLDWTEGCIAMSDERMDFLVERVTPGTPVTIRP